MPELITSTNFEKVAQSGAMTSSSSSSSRLSIFAIRASFFIRATYL